ncbi:MAG: hypothetical protein EOO88_54825 [Pedobacter sp.]|nr:MAG: hypothetical protein EOO88_54825 [Pedobacter sp.]
MLAKLVKAVQLVGNMGWRYVFFRTGFELRKRSGLLQKAFPLNPPVKTYLTLQEWRAGKASFFFKSKDDVKLSQPLSDELRQQYEKLSADVYPFFSSLEFDLGENNVAKRLVAGCSQSGGQHR